MTVQPPCRRATPADAPALAEFVHFASYGMALYLWTQMAGPGGDPWRVGRDRAGRDAGGFSWRNGFIAESGGRVAAGLISFALPAVAEPIPATLPPMFRPLQELENLAPATWYVNVLAAYPKHRGKGFGTQLLALADTLAREAGARGLSIIVADANTGARRLYERCGYRKTAQRPIVKEGWETAARNWVLLVKPDARA